LALRTKICLGLEAQVLGLGLDHAVLGLVIPPRGLVDITDYMQQNNDGLYSKRCIRYND